MEVWTILFLFNWVIFRFQIFSDSMSWTGATGGSEAESYLNETSYPGTCVVEHGGTYAETCKTYSFAGGC